MSEKPGNKPSEQVAYTHRPPRKLSVVFDSFAEFVTRTGPWLSKVRLFVETDQAVTLGSTVHVELRLRERPVLIRALGEVCEVDAEEGGARGVVLDVRYLDPAAAGLIDSVLRHLPERESQDSQEAVGDDGESAPVEVPDDVELALDTWEDEVGMMVESALPDDARAAKRQLATAEQAAAAMAAAEAAEAADTSTAGADSETADAETADAETADAETADAETADAGAVAPAPVPAADEAGSREDTTPAAVDGEREVTIETESFDLELFEQVRTSDLDLDDAFAAVDRLSEQAEGEEAAARAAEPWTGLETTRIPQVELDAVVDDPPPQGLASGTLDDSLLLDAATPITLEEAEENRARLEELARGARASADKALPPPTARRTASWLPLLVLLLAGAAALWLLVPRAGGPSRPHEKAADEPAADVQASTTPAPSPVVAEPAPPPVVAEPSPAEPAPPIVAAPVTAAPAPALPPPPPAVPPPATVTRAEREAAIRSAVQAWSAAWSAQRADDYLAVYADDFQPADGSSRAAWAAQRKQRVEAPERIAVTVEQLRIEALRDDSAQALFFQIYETERLRRATWKRFDMVLRDGRWQIRRELVERGPQ